MLNFTDSCHPFPLQSGSPRSNWLCSIFLFDVWGYKTGSKQVTFEESFVTAITRSNLWAPGIWALCLWLSNRLKPKSGCWQPIQRSKWLWKISGLLQPRIRKHESPHSAMRPSAKTLDPGCLFIIWDLPHLWGLVGCPDPVLTSIQVPPILQGPV